MQNRAIVAQDLQDDIFDHLEEAEFYLDNHLLYNHASQDVSETFREKVMETQKLLNKSQKSEQDFNAFQISANHLSLYVMTQIKYPKNDPDEFIFKMRKLTDLLRLYSANCTPAAPKKTASSSKLFKNKPDETLELEQNKKPIREESFNHPKIPAA